MIETLLLGLINTVVALRHFRTPSAPALRRSRMHIGLLPAICPTSEHFGDDQSRPNDKSHNRDNNHPALDGHSGWTHRRDLHDTLTVVGYLSRLSRRFR